ncbi:FxSxx-COOH system tetratricopeptide repeat protein [Dactylosporangium cerinum]|uniref:FxSxx-COOH system tetratricopeptide repeat protein n=1 Tax=Dactylosporangium cerinum TaxID=1434730 RepID=A0ABV9WL26_9ACTN
MAERRNGQVVTFYSFKGGTGRTMAVANVAWILAAHGQRVLVVDWDLESPGLHRFFRPFITDSMLAGTGGVIDLIRRYEGAARKASLVDPGAPGRLDHARYARVSQEAFSIKWEFGNGGVLDFLSAGRHNHHYSRSISGLNWDDFYEELDGDTFFTALREDMKANYDYTLIDSRTGLSDVADICTVHLPDTLVTCFTLSEQGIDGAAEVAQAISRKTIRSGPPSTRSSRRIRVLPVPMRIDPAELKKAETGKLVAKQRFAGLPEGLSETDRDQYWTTVEVPYRAFYAYEETLATFEDERGQPGTLLAAFETMTGYITKGAVTRLPPMNQADRARVRAQFVRMAALVDSELTLRYDRNGAVWAEWIGWILRESGIRVHDAAGAAGAAADVARHLVINAGDSDAGRPIAAGPPDRPPLVVHVAGNQPPVGSSDAVNTTRISGFDPLVAADRILRLVGVAPPAPDLLVGAPRFPAQPPEVVQAPVRNLRFTGREAELDTLRERLSEGGESTVLVGLHGLGGIGKSQLAIEYANRYRNSYDAVWWIDADATTAEVDEQLQQFGLRMGIPLPGGTTEAAQAVKQALTRGEPYARWLLLFDNAEDPSKIEGLLPSGRGHVIVIAQTTVWGEQAKLIPVEKFTRQESVVHLRSRLPSLDDADAARIAELLGDLPIAIAAAAAWLDETGSPVTEYLQAIEKGNLGLLGSERDLDRVAAAWKLSLDQLQEQEPAAYRMLELCSVMAPEISLDLIYSSKMALNLFVEDPMVTANEMLLMLSQLVEKITRLALVRVDNQGEFGAPGADRVRGGHIEIHRLLQYVVRSRMSEETMSGTRHEVHLLLIAAVQVSMEVDDPADWPRYRMLWPHIEVSGAEGCVSAQVRQLLIDRVRYFFLTGSPARGLEIAERTERVWTGMLDGYTEAEAAGQAARALRLQLLLLRFNKANILRDKGAFKEALELDQQVLDDQRALLGPDHPNTLMTAGSFAADLRSLGRYADALEQDQKTYEAWRRAKFNDENALTLRARSNLAVSYRLMGNLREALNLDRQVYATRKERLPKNHPSTLLSGTSLGRDLREAGDFEESINLLTEIRDAYAVVLGADSRFVVNARANLAVSLRASGRPDEAGRLLDQAWEHLKAELGPDHPETLACRLSRSVNRFELEEEDAEAEIRAVREAYEKRLGARHPHTLVCVTNLAAATRAQGHLGTARELAREAMEGMREVLGPKHPYALAAQMNLAVVEADDNNFEVARTLMADAALDLVEVLGPEHPHTLRCEANRAIIDLRVHGHAYQERVNIAIDKFADRVGQGHPAVQALRRGRLLRRIIDPHPF